MERTDVGSSPFVEAISFELTDKEYSSLSRREAAFTQGRRAGSILSLTAAGCFFVVAWLDGSSMHAGRQWWYLVAALVNAGSGAFGLLSPKWLYPKNARRANLSVDAAGLTGDVDGRRFELPWKSIDSVNDDGDFFIVRYAGTKRVISIPKRAVTSGHSLWNIFSEALTAKRGLVVRADRRLIINSIR